MTSLCAWPAQHQAQGVEVTDIRDLAAEISNNLREHFADSDERLRQACALAEEAGEVQEAYLAYLRGGPLDDVAAELADVVITTHVTAVVLDIRLDEPQPIELDPSMDAWQYVMDLGVRGTSVLAAYCRWAGMKRRLGPWEDVVAGLNGLLSAASATARVLGVDLEDAVWDKAEQIMTRGWRDKPAAVTR